MLHSVIVRKQWAFELSDEKLNKAFAEFKSLADRKKEVTEEDLVTILTEQQVSIEDVALFELKSVQVQYGTKIFRLRQHLLIPLKVM